MSTFVPLMNVWVDGSRNVFAAALNNEVQIRLVSNLVIVGLELRAVLVVPHAQLKRPTTDPIRAFPSWISNSAWARFRCAIGAARRSIYQKTIWIGLRPIMSVHRSGAIAS